MFHRHVLITQGTVMGIELDKPESIWESWGYNIKYKGLYIYINNYNIILKRIIQYYTHITHTHTYIYIY